MKTRFMIRNSITYVSYILVFLWGIFTAKAQCPTVINSNPVICDASNFTFADLDAFADDSVSGNGIVWYDADTGGNSFPSSQLVEQTIYYAGDSSGTCGTRESISVTFEVNPSGQNLDGIFCQNENPTIQLYIDEVLQPNIPSGGSVEVYTDLELMIQANSADAIPNGATNYYIVFLNSSGCRSQVEGGSTAVFNAPEDPTPSNPQEFCSDTNPTVNDLDPGTTSSFSWYENVDGMGEVIPPALALSTTLIDGSTYYIQVNDIFCISNAVPVTVTINDPVDPGTSASLEYCFDNIPTSNFNLFDELTGDPDTNGTWTGPLSTSNGHLGNVNISSLTTPGSYVFTYTVPPAGVCPEGSSTVTIIIREVLTSGIPSAANPASFCEADLISDFDLFSMLDNEDPDGLWTQGTSSTDPAVNSPIDLTGFIPGTYNFTYSQNVDPNPCPEESTTVQVIVLQDPNAGLAVNQIFCENDLMTNSPFNLFDALDGSQDNDLGIWTDSVGSTVSNPIDITGFDIDNSPYTFTYTIDNGTCMDTEDITITVEPAPESGNALSPFEVCEEDLAANSPFDLFALLDGTQDNNGTWYDGADTTGSVVTNPIDISGLSDGTYNYTYSVPLIGTCSDVDVIVQIIVLQGPNAGIAVNQIFCENDLVTNSPFDLFTALDGSQDNDLGIWTDSGGSIVSNPIDITGFDIDNSPYTYTYTIDNGDCIDTENITITIEPAPESGNALSPFEVCEEDLSANSPFDLFTMLDGTQDNNGTWYEGTDTTGTVAPNPVDISGLSNGTYNYTYSVPLIGTCSDVDVIVQIIILQDPNAGIAVNQIFCENDLITNSPFDLFDALDGSQDNDLGTWTDSGGSTVSNPINITGLDVDNSPYTYTYTIDNGTCIDTEDITIAITPAPNAGSDATAELCLINGIVDLTTYLGGIPDTNGTWNPVLTSGTNDFDPNVDLAGIYTYTVLAVAPCTTDSIAQLTVSISDSPAPSVIDPIATFCLSENPTVADLDISVSGESIIWYEDDTSTSPLDSTAILLDGDDYFATQTTSTGCESVLRVQVIVDLNDSSTPTLEIDGNEFCVSDLPTLLDLTENIVEFDSDTNNIVWYDDATAGSVLNVSALLNHDTTYYAALIDPITGCESSIRLAVTADLTSCGLLLFPDGFSPNGDGVNDTYLVENLAFIYPNFTIEIFNRYGNVVYKGNASSQNFDGTSNQSRLVSKGDLPVGVYFYVLNFNDGTKSKQGRLYLSR